MNLYYSGQMVTISAQFTVSGVLADPDTVTFIIYNPTSGSGNYTYPGAGAGPITRVATGQYYANWTNTHTGQYRAYWRGTGVNAASATAWGCVGILPN
jgi:hypothetical protein